MVTVTVVPLPTALMMSSLPPWSPLEKRILPEAVLVSAVQRLREIELGALRLSLELAVPQEADHLVGRHLERVERRALELGRQEARGQAGPQRMGLSDGSQRPSLSGGSLASAE
jgi:hypothetical protein